MPSYDQKNPGIGSTALRRVKKSSNQLLALKPVDFARPAVAGTQAACLRERGSFVQEKL